MANENLTIQFQDAAALDTMRTGMVASPAMIARRVAIEGKARAYNLEQATGSMEKQDRERADRLRTRTTSILSAATTMYGGGGLGAAVAGAALNPVISGAIHLGQAAISNIAPYSGELSGAMAQASAARSMAMIRAGQQLGGVMGGITGSLSKIETAGIDSLTAILKPFLEAAAPILEVIGELAEMVSPIIKEISDILVPLVRVTADVFRLVVKWPLAAMKIMFELLGKVLKEIEKFVEEITKNGGVGGTIKAAIFGAREMDPKKESELLGRGISPVIIGPDLVARNNPEFR